MFCCWCSSHKLPHLARSTKQGNRFSRLSFFSRTHQIHPQHWIFGLFQAHTIEMKVSIKINQERSCTKLEHYLRVKTDYPLWIKVLATLRFSQIYANEPNKVWKTSTINDYVGNPFSFWLTSQTIARSNANQCVEKLIESASEAEYSYHIVLMDGFESIVSWNDAISSFRSKWFFAFKIERNSTLTIQLANFRCRHLCI